MKKLNGKIPGLVFLLIMIILSLSAIAVYSFGAWVQSGVKL